MDPGDTPDSFREPLGFRQQRENEKVVRREIEEVTGVDARL
jgi:hypothetical protein